MMTTQKFDAAQAAEPLIKAWNEGPRPTGLTPQPVTTVQAYQVQQAVMAGLNDMGGVWKMALLGGTDRQAAILPHRALYQSGAQPALPLNAAIEVETALILNREPLADDPMACIAEIRLAFELIAPRYAPDAGFTPLESMADGFRSAGVVLGDVIPGWQQGLPDCLGIDLTLDGTHVTAPEAAAPLDAALDFLLWLADHARSQGRSLKQGDVIITGARLGPMPFDGARPAHAKAMGASVRLGPTA